MLDGLRQGLVSLLIPTIPRDEHGKTVVLATRLRVNHDKVAEIEILWRLGYWLFNADAYLKCSSSEKWDPIPASARDTRATLVPRPARTSMRFSKGRRRWCRGAARAAARQATFTPATDPPPTAAMSASRAV